MANLRRSSKDKQQPNQGCCRRHPKHRQSPGVCSLCLVEKLSRLSADSNLSRCIAAPVSSSSSSLSSYYSSPSSSASSYSSPMHRYTEGKDSKYSFSLLLFGGKNILTKSRSVAFANSKKKSGLLSKLLNPTNSTKRKLEEATTTASLEHSRTMREILTTKVH